MRKELRNLILYQTHKNVKEVSVCPKFIFVVSVAKWRRVENAFKPGACPLYLKYCRSILKILGGITGLDGLWIWQLTVDSKCHFQIPHISVQDLFHSTANQRAMPFIWGNPNRDIQISKLHETSLFG